MEKWQRSVITSVRSRLIIDMDVKDVLLSGLVTDKIITNTELKTFKTKVDPTERASDLLLLIETRINAFQSLILNLFRTLQMAQAKILLDKVRLVNPIYYDDIMRKWNAENDANEGVAESSPEQIQTPVVSVGQAALHKSSQGTSIPLVAQDTVDGKVKIKILLLINIITFDQSNKKRNGADQDSTNLISTFTRLGYQIFPPIRQQRKYYGCDDIVRVIKEFKEECERIKPESCVIYIGTHGCSETIGTSDDKKISCTKLFMQFYHDKFPVMANKSKLMLIQACRSEVVTDTDSLEMFDLEDRSADVPLPPLSLGSNVVEDSIHPAPVHNLIVVHAQVPGLPAGREPANGSYLPIAVCELLDNHSGTITLLDFLSKVQTHVEGRNLLPKTGQVCEARLFGSFGNFSL